MPEASHVYRKRYEQHNIRPRWGRTNLDKWRFYKHVNPPDLNFINSIKTNIYPHAKYLFANLHSNSFCR